MCGTCGCNDSTTGITLTKYDDRLIHEQDHHHHHDHDHDHNEHHIHPHTHSSLKRSVIDVEQDILHQNNSLAARNREYFNARTITALNLVSSPGSGKTTILERTIKDMDESRFNVIEGDQQSQNDAARIAALQVPVVQINTGKGCHLESDMVYEAVKSLDITVPNSFLMIENVGNLVCPSMFDLGEQKRVVIISVTEGEDKPIKYPDMFHTSDVCLINKVDLLPYLEMDLNLLKENIKKVKPDMLIFDVSATKGDGMNEWYQWLTEIQNR
ncbi:MAG: hydrogenase nickel incorporation protein HypB [Flavobacteriaceae bacterium]|nr:hydrogenase nickel incorporation protein HypB [Bacteroidia bacterium]MBT8288063.1 hydrogenase nickel incorporation protein HypB [Bacteroidia bacterium]NNF75831.1 hydrogenase nickel incorporation protein HypB [Flavobacteriaceae bacterium]NNK74416.1 hydrogenase nickel incorporation protein HypB [Flavobacteriaceae bacterium]